MQSPPQWTPENASVFGLTETAEAYGRRPDYPPEVVALLKSLAVPSLPVLELGAGTAQLGRALAPAVPRVDAVELYPEMVRVGRSLPGGEHPHLQWHIGSAEEFPDDGPYGLAFAAAALHWMDWEAVLRAVGRALAPDAVFAIVSGISARVAWGSELGAIVQRHSTLREFAPFNLIEHLQTKQLFAIVGHHRTSPKTLEMSIDSYVDWLHTQSGFARERMTNRGIEFDREVRSLVAPYADGSALSVEIDSDVDYGRPTTRT